MRDTILLAAEPLQQCGPAPIRPLPPACFSAFYRRLLHLVSQRGWSDTGTPHRLGRGAPGRQDGGTVQGHINDCLLRKST